MIHSEADSPHMTVFSPGEMLLELIRAEACEVDLFVRKPPVSAEDKALYA